MRLDKIDEKDDWIKNYQKQRWIMLHISITEQLEYCDDEIFEYSKTVWKLSAVREYCIDKKISIGDYAAAIDILYESIELDKEFSGLIDKYRHKLKDIYITVEDMQSYKQKLWEIVTKSIRYVLAKPEIYTLGQYESALVEQYPEQILNKYEEFLQKSACNTATRKTYRNG